MVPYTVMKRAGPPTAGYLWKKQPEAAFPVTKQQQPLTPPAAGRQAGDATPVSDLDAALSAAGGGAGPGPTFQTR